MTLLTEEYLNDTTTSLFLSSTINFAFQTTEISITTKQGFIQNNVTWVCYWYIKYFFLNGVLVLTYRVSLFFNSSICSENVRLTLMID